MTVLRESGITNGIGGHNADHIEIHKRLNRGMVGGALRRSSSLLVQGHSYTTDGATHADYLWHAELGRMIGATVTSRGVSGSKLMANNGPQGGFANVLQNLAQVGSRTLATKFHAPLLGAVACCWGLNDAADTVTTNGANTAQTVTAWGHAVRSVLSHFQLSVLLQSEDASITLGGSGTWATFGATTQNSGTGYSQNSSAGGTITITTPSGWKSRVLALGFVTNRTGGSVPAGTATFTLDGSPVTPIGQGGPSLSTANVNPSALGTAGSAVARFLIPDGAHTLVVTTGSGGLAFDRVVSEADVPRPVLFANIARTPNASATVLTTLGLMNALTESIIEDEFAGKAALVDIDAALDKNADLFSDGTHPNDRGHALIAEAFAEAFARLPQVAGSLALGS